MHPAVDEIRLLSPSLTGMLQTAAQIRNEKFLEAFILPNSFRSALIAYLGRIPQRTGLRGHFRSVLLTKVVTLPRDVARYHQSHEYAVVFNQSLPNEAMPEIRLNKTCLEKAHVLLSRPGNWIGLIPGAARGPSKRWPVQYFARLGNILRQKHQCNIVIFGSEDDREICACVSRETGNSLLNLAGKTSLQELAALFSCCAAVIGNDSGGIHLAAAAGAAVIGVFGITDPAKTRPLGRRVTILQAGAQGSRDIPRRSKEAQQSLKSITPEMVAEEFDRIIAG
jgi:heptosyltransferase-2